MEPPSLELGTFRMPVSAILDVRFGTVLGFRDPWKINKVPKVGPWAGGMVLGWKKKRRKKEKIMEPPRLDLGTFRMQNVGPWSYDPKHNMYEKM